MSAYHRMHPERSQPLNLRASDQDRDAVIELLRAHSAEGRLDAAELDERTGAALAARTRGQLAALLADLPPTGPPRSAPRQRAFLRAHLGTYVAVNVMLVVIWALTGFGYPWFVWPLLGWGTGIAFHASCGRGSRRRLARSAAEQALGIRAERLGAASGRSGQPALER